MIGNLIPGISGKTIYWLSTSSCLYLKILSIIMNTASYCTYMCIVQSIRLIFFTLAYLLNIAINWVFTYIRRDICVIFSTIVHCARRWKKPLLTEILHRYVVGIFNKFYLSYYIWQSWTLSIYHSVFLSVFSASKDLLVILYAPYINYKTCIFVFLVFLSIVCLNCHLCAWFCVSFL
jgi:hypothetical protein